MKNLFYILLQANPALEGFEISTKFSWWSIVGGIAVIIIIIYFRLRKR